MNLYENSYDCVCTVPYEVRLLAGQFYPEIYSNVTASTYGLTGEEGGSISIAWALTYFFRRHFPENDVIQFKINAVNLKHFQASDECLDIFGYNKIFKYHVIGYGFRPLVSYLTDLPERQATISNYDITHINYASDEGETTWEFGIKDPPQYGSYISYKNDWGVFPDHILGKIPFTGTILPSTASIYVYRTLILRIHLSIRSNY